MDTPTYISMNHWISSLHFPEEDAQPTAPPDKGKRVLRVNSQKAYKLGASRRHNRGRIVIPDLEDDRRSCSKYGSLSTAEVNKVQDALNSKRNKNKDVHASSVTPALDVPATSLNPNMQLARATGENLNARNFAENHSKKDKSVPPPSIHPTLAEMVASILEERNKNKDVHALSVNPARNFAENHSKKDTSVPPPSIHPTLAEMVASILEERNKNKDVHALSVNPALDVPATSLNPDMELALATGENLNASAFAENHSKKDKSVPSPSIHRTHTPAQAEEGNRESRAVIHQNEVLRPSLMERNGTARTYEWEDSVDVSGTPSCTEICRLPIPKVTYVSPLKVCELKKWTRRRKRHMWSPEEEQALYDGVTK
ncbi:hypothetical protein CCACVL1_15273 [Corchorus capsularis]|uniref:Uncharacterized protein n=1 Tax=Corchorus capsularis TaxID=210143 RepID=A0A1R3I302_COCAP|nr:hypothetical protein CCACVL1_15273 [Corchorus capsularis]